MKAIIFMTFILGLISLSCFSQEKKDLKIDMCTLALSINNPTNKLKTPDLKTNYQIKKPIEIGSFLTVPELKNKQYYDFNKNIVMTDNKNSFDNMPIFIPKTNSVMPIFKPDSITKYTLLIKKIK